MFKKNEMILSYRLSLTDYEDYFEGGNQWFDFTPRGINKIDVGNIFNRGRMNPVDQRIIEKMPPFVMKWVDEVKNGNGCNKPLADDSPYLIAKVTDIPQFSVSSGESIKELMLGTKISDLFYVEEVQ